MNKAERRFFSLALFLFGLGWVARLGALVPLSPFAMETLPVVETLEESTKLSSTDTSVAPSGSSAVNPKAETKARKKKTATRKALTGPVSINRATADQLCLIKGVGPALAAKIINHRERMGPFRSAADLDRVPGIGDKKLKSICEWVVFD